MYLLMMSLLLCRRRGEGVRKLAKSCRRHLWTAPYKREQVKNELDFGFREPCSVLLTPRKRKIILFFENQRGLL